MSNIPAPPILLAATINPAAVPRDQWATRIAQARRCGMNSVVVPPGPDPDFAAECDAQGIPVIVRTDAPAGTPYSDVEYDALKAFAEGATEFVFGDAPFTRARFAARRAALFAASFAHILAGGEHRESLKASPGLRVSEVATKQNGAVVFVENASDTETVSGYVPPFLPDITLRPREIFAYVHDAPVGGPVEGGKFLASYVGLVKSDAKILSAHIRPSGFEGARVFVYGEPGETKEVVLFHGSERGQSISITFSDAPLMYPVGVSQIIALPTELAGRTFLPLDNENAPVIIGPDDVTEHDDDFATVEVAPGRTHTLYSLDTEGAVTAINIAVPGITAPPPPAVWQAANDTDFAALDFDDSDWLQIEEPTAINTLGVGGEQNGWYRARIESPVGASGTLQFAACSEGVTVYINGVRASDSDSTPEGNQTRTLGTASFEVELREGENVIAVSVSGTARREGEPQGIYGLVTLFVPGSCWLMEVTRWKFRVGAYADEATVTVRIAL